MKKPLIMFSSFALLVLALAGCKGNESESDKNNDPTPTPSVSATATPEPTPEPVVEEEGFKEVLMDLGGRKITLMSVYSSRYTYAADKDKTINDTLWVIEQLKEIGRDYNCEIVVEQAPSNNQIVPNFTAMKAAGDIPFDIFEGGVSDLSYENIYSNNIILPVSDPKVVDIIKPNEYPWSVESKLSEMFGIQYGVTFCMINNSDIIRAVMLFNKGLIDKYSLENPYDLVKSRQWTWEKLEEMSAKIAAQSDGDVVPIDRPGESVLVPAMVFSNNGVVTENSPEGYKFVANTNDRTLAALNFTVDLINKGYLVSPSGAKTFGNGHAVFSVAIYSELRKLTNQVIVNEIECGLLPMPLGPDAIASGMEYHSVTYTSAMYNIVNNKEKPEEIAAILVAMANRLKKEDIIKTELDFNLQDTESAEMLELMMNNVIIDVSRAVGTARSSIRNANNAILDGSKTTKQAFDEIADEIKLKYESILIVE